MEYKGKHEPQMKNKHDKPGIKVLWKDYHLPRYRWGSFIP